jgi:hypothetical protein
MTTAMTSTQGRELSCIVCYWFAGKRKGSENRKGKEKTRSDRSLGNKTLNDRESGIGT